MIKIIYILFFTLLFLSQNILKAAENKNSKTFFTSFELTKNFKIELSSGEWNMVQRKIYTQYGLRAISAILIKKKNGKLLEAIAIEQVNTAGVYESIVNNAINTIIFKNKYDGCYERPEYFYLNFYAKGSTHNCFRVGHRNIKKRIYDPRDRELKAEYTDTKKWIKENSIDLPNIALFSSHNYFSRLAGGRFFSVEYYVDPSILDGPENNFFSEETSEYHKARIQNYSKHLSTMKKWMIISANKHKSFEKFIKTKKNHLLNLSQFTSQITKLSNDTSFDIINQIQKINDLYKSGVLTKEEFEKAKKKILN